MPLLLWYDFYYLWAVGSIIAAGGNPYDLAHLSDKLQSIGWPQSEIPQGFTHPPLVIWFYWILGQMNFQVAAVLTVCLSLALMIVAVRMLSSFREDSNFDLYLISTLLFPPVISNFIWGQINMLPLFGLVLFAWATKKELFTLAGLGLSLISFKPHLFLPLLLVVLIWELRKLRFRIIAGLSAGFCLQAVTSLILCPEIFSWYVARLNLVVAEYSGVCGASLSQLLTCEFGWIWSPVVLTVLGILTAILLTIHYGYNTQNILNILVPLSLVASIYSWSHHLVILIPAFLEVIRNVSRKWDRKRIIAVLSLFSFASLLLIGNSHTWILLAVILLLFNCTLRSSANSKIQIN